VGNSCCHVQNSIILRRILADLGWKLNKQILFWMFLHARCLGIFVMCLSLIPEWLVAYLPFVVPGGLGLRMWLGNTRCLTTTTINAVKLPNCQLVIITLLCSLWSALWLLGQSGVARIDCSVNSGTWGSLNHETASLGTEIRNGWVGKSVDVPKMAISLSGLIMYYPGAVPSEVSKSINLGNDDCSRLAMEAHHT
jgi:hypothetical protein